MKRYHSLIKNLKFISLLCFLFLGLVGCKGNNSMPIGDNSNPSNPNGTTTPTTSSSNTTSTTQKEQEQEQEQEQDDERSNIASQLTAPNIHVDNIGGGLSLFSVGSDLQLNGYQILYQVEIASDEEFANIIYNQHVSVQEVDQNGNTYYIPDFENVNWPTLTTGQTYHIRVRRVARKQGEQDIVGAYSDATEFTAPDLTCFTPVSQTTTLASSQQNHVLNFSVHATNSNCGSAVALLINSHEFEIASDQQFNTIVQTGTMSHQATLLNASNLSRNFTLNNKLSNGTYYWRVRNRVVLDTGDVIVGPYSSGVQLTVSQ